MSKADYLPVDFWQQLAMTCLEEGNFENPINNSK